MSGSMVNSDENRFIEDVYSDYHINSIIPLSIRKNLTIIPIAVNLPDSSKTKNRDKKWIDDVLCESKQPLTSSNLKNSKELTISPIENKENNILTKLKKLPEITFDFVKSDQIFKVPKIPKCNKNYPKKITRSEVIFKKKVMSREPNNIKKNNNSVFINYKKINTNFKRTLNEKPKQLDNNNQFISNNIDNIIIQNNKEAASKKCTYLEMENLHKTSSPSDQSRNVNTPKSVENESNTFNTSHKVQSLVKTISNDDSIINNMPIKINDFAANEECMTTDSNLSNDGQILPASITLPFIFY